MVDPTPHTGERSLVVDGFKFTKSREGMGNRVFWRCSRRECKATAVTVADRVEHIRSVHTHLPPVAAEFFAGNNERREQEVRFSSNVSTAHRARPRRSSQPTVVRTSEVQYANNMDQFLLLPAEKTDAERYSSSSSLPTLYPADQVIDSRNCIAATTIDNKDQSNMMSASNGFCTETLTALITHLVESGSSGTNLKIVSTNQVVAVLLLVLLVHTVPLMVDRL